jgi:hypothetical protein
MDPPDPHLASSRAVVGGEAVKHTSQTPAAARSGQHSANLQMPAWPRSGPDPARLARSGPDLPSASQLPDSAAGGRRRPGLNRPSPHRYLPELRRRLMGRARAIRDGQPPPPESWSRRRHRHACTSAKPPCRRGANRAVVPFAKHASLNDHYGPRRRHRTRGEKGGPAATSARALPGGAVRRRRGGGRGE